MGYWCPECQNVFDDKFDIEKNQCKQCGSLNVVYIPNNLSLNMGELFLISNISNDKNFCQAMVDLKEKDIIEYNLKLSQLKKQVEQQNNIKQQDSNAIKCPYCHSTNIKKITNTSKAVHTALFGVFSVSRNSKQFHCNNCGADF